jgi:hypothetical protein
MSAKETARLNNILYISVAEKFKKSSTTKYRKYTVTSDIKIYSFDDGY